MRIKLTLTLLCGMMALQGAIAGSSWSPPAKGGKCPIEPCPDIGASVAIGYETDYIFRGVRLTEDAIWMDANYTFDLPRISLPLTIGVKHVTGLLSRGTGLGPSGVILPVADGDHTNLYASVVLPSLFGFDTVLGYDHYFYSNQRGPSPGGAAPIFGGDSHGAISLNLSRELFRGIVGSYHVAYDFVTPGQYGFLGGFPVADNGAWIHDIGLSKDIALNDRMALALSAGFVHTDNVWPLLTTFPGAGGLLVDRTSSSGWNHYYIQAGLPIALNCRATLTPYIGYNGTPDGWMADGVNGDVAVPNGTNDNDIFHGGVSLRVNF